MNYILYKTIEEIEKIGLFKDDRTTNITKDILDIIKQLLSLKEIYVKEFIDMVRFGYIENSILVLSEFTGVSIVESTAFVNHIITNGGSIENTSLHSICSSNYVKEYFMSLIETVKTKLD